MDLQPDPAFTTGGDVTLKAHIFNSGVPDPSQEVFFSTSGNGATITASTHASPDPTVPDPPNTYPATLSPGTSDTQTVTASFTPDSGKTTCFAFATVQKISSTRALVVEFSPAAIPAKTTFSNPQTTATVTVVNSSGAPKSGDTVTLTLKSSDRKDSCSDTTISDPSIPPTNPPGPSQTLKDNGDGTYSATVNGGTKAARCTFEATDSADATAKATGVLVQYGAPATVVLSAPQPNTIPGNGAATAIAKAKVTDEIGNAVPQAGVSFGSNDPDVKLAPNPATTDDTGVAGTQLTASKQVGPEQLFAFAGANVKSNTVTWTQTQPVNTTALTLNPKFLPADGASTGQAIASVLDSTGNPLAGQSITFAASGDVKLSSNTGTTGSDGKATITITAGKTVGNQTITATNASNGQVATATLGLTTPQRGYWLVASDGGIFSHGTAGFFGSEGGGPLNKPIVGMAATPSTKGYWLVASDGGIFAHGDAGFFGSQGGSKLNKPIVGMAATPSGKGYWMVASDGGIFAFGDASFFGSEGGGPLNKPIVGMTTTPTGKGYWLVASDGGLFAHGDAGFFGSEGGGPLNKPVVGMASTPTGKGYWLVASDGGIFAHGDAGFFGSTGNIKLNKPVVAMTPTPTGLGYWFVASDGGIFNYGDAPFLGSEGGAPLNKPIVGMASSSTG